MTTLTPHRPLAPLTRAADGRALAVALAAGVAFDIGLRSDVVSLGGAVAVVAVAWGLAASRRVETGVGRACLAVAAAFGPFLAWRTSPWLVAIDLLVVAGALVAGVVLARDARLTALGPRLLVGRLAAALGPALTGVAFLVAPVPTPWSGSAPATAPAPACPGTTPPPGPPTPGRGSVPNRRPRRQTSASVKGVAPPSIGSWTEERRHSGRR